MRAISLEDEEDEEKKQFDELKSLMQSINDRFGSFEEFIRNYQIHTGDTVNPVAAVK